MALEEFRHIDIVWNKAIEKIYTPVNVVSSDDSGRKLVVQLLDDNIVADTTDCDLYLYWNAEENYGFNKFKVADSKKGIYEIYFSHDLLNHIGKHKGWLYMIDSEGAVTSEPFRIEVIKGINYEAVEGSDDWSGLTEGLAKIRKIEEEEKKRVNAENIRVSNENTRKKSEDSRKSAESSRNSAENTRNTNESNRKVEETKRGTNEVERGKAEDTRKLNENKRSDDESKRASAETARNKAENDRKTAEDNRSSSESKRADEEKKRVSSENSRVAEEKKRVTAEADRASAESTRKSNETTRTNNENARKGAEETRKSNESKRVSAENEREKAETFRKEEEKTRDGNENVRQYNYNLWDYQLAELDEKVKNGYFNGKKGDKGDPGPAGKIENLTKTQVTEALGYIPPKQSDIDAHANKKDNPHNVTKSQVGLGSVVNQGVASKAEAEAGSSNGAYMTPLRTKEALDKYSKDITYVSNSRGEAIKFPNGTMICWNVEKMSNRGIDVAWGNLYGNNYKFSNFPVNFIETPAIIKNIYSDFTMIQSTAGQPSKTNPGEVEAERPVPLASATNTVGTYIAFGKWK